VRRLIAVIAGTTMILLLAAAPARATFHGKNGRIAYRRFFNQARTWGAIFTIQPNGTGTRKVTHPGKGILDDTPDWSPDGRWIAFRRDRKGVPSHIFRIHANGKALKDLSKATCSALRSLEDASATGEPRGRRAAHVSRSCADWTVGAVGLTSS
jgi:TolB protein